MAFYRFFLGAYSYLSLPMNLSSTGCYHHVSDPVPYENTKFDPYLFEFARATRSSAASLYLGFMIDVF